jgi:hypothetical protein
MRPRLFPCKIPEFGYTGRKEILNDDYYPQHTLAGSALVVVHP